MPGFSYPAVAGRPGEIHTSRLNDVGTIATTTDNKEYIYLVGVASTVAGSWVAFDEAGATLLLDSDVAASVVSQLAVASAATVASTWGWYQISGPASASVASATADNGKLYANAAAGMADDTPVTGNQIHGAYARAATTTDAVALSSVQISRPFIGVADAII